MTGRFTQSQENVRRACKGLAKLYDIQFKDAPPISLPNDCLNVFCSDDRNITFEIMSAYKCFRVSTALSMEKQCAETLLKKFEDVYKNASYKKITIKNFVGPTGRKPIEFGLFKFIEICKKSKETEPPKFEELIWTTDGKFQDERNDLQRAIDLLSPEKTTVIIEDCSGPQNPINANNLTIVLSNFYLLFKNSSLFANISRRPFVICCNEPCTLKHFMFVGDTLFRFSLPNPGFSYRGKVGEEFFKQSEEDYKCDEDFLAMTLPGHLTMNYMYLRAQGGGDASQGCLLYNSLQNPAIFMFLSYKREDDGGCAILYDACSPTSVLQYKSHMDKIEQDLKFPVLFDVATIPSVVNNLP